MTPPLDRVCTDRERLTWNVKDDDVEIGLSEGQRRRLVRRTVFYKELAAAMRAEHRRLYEHVRRIREMPKGMVRARLLTEAEPQRQRVHAWLARNGELKGKDRTKARCGKELVS